LTGVPGVLISIARHQHQKAQHGGYPGLLENAPESCDPAIKFDHSELMGCIAEYVVGKVTLVPSCLGPEKHEKKECNTGGDNRDMQVPAGSRELEQVIYLHLLVRRALALEIAVSEPTERYSVVGTPKRVDMHHAGTQGADHAVSAPELIGPDSCGKTQLGGVGHLDRVGLLLEAGDGQDRPKDFVANQRVIGLLVQYNGRLHVTASGVCKDKQPRTCNTHLPRVAKNPVDYRLRCSIDILSIVKHNMR